MEANNLPKVAYKTMVIRTFKELSENFNKEIANIRKDRETIKKNHEK